MRSACQYAMGIDDGEFPSCRVCAGTRSHVESVAALSKTYSDHHSSKDPTSKVVCVACLHAMRGKPPDCLRMFSVAWTPECETGIAPLPIPAWTGNKGDMLFPASLLCWPPDGPWVCAIADSGKVHTLPHAEVNAGAGAWIVRVDRQSIGSDPTTFREVFGRVTKLVLAGFSRASIWNGRPTPNELSRHAAVWRAAGTESYAKSPILNLALICTKKEYADEWHRRLF